MALLRCGYYTNYANISIRIAIHFTSDSIADYATMAIRHHIFIREGHVV
jgi:hypothetical protein